MAVNTISTISFAIANGQTFSNTAVTSQSGFRLTRCVAVPALSTSAPIEINAGLVAGIGSLYLHFSAPCTFTIDSGTIITSISAGDTVGILGTAASSLLGTLSNGATFNTMYVTTTTLPTVIDILVTLDPTV